MKKIKRLDLERESRKRTDESSLLPSLSPRWLGAIRTQEVPFGQTFYHMASFAASVVIN